MMLCLSVLFIKDTCQIKTVISATGKQLIMILLCAFDALDCSLESSDNRNYGFECKVGLVVTSAGVIFNNYVPSL